MSVDSCGVTAPSTADSKLPICSWLVAWLRLELGSLSPWSWSVFPLCPADCWLAWDLHQTRPGCSCVVGGLWKGGPGTVQLWLPELPAEAQTTMWSAPTPSHNSCPRDPRHLESGRGWVLLCLREKWMQASDGRRGLLGVEGLRTDRNQCIVGNAPSIYVPNARANCGHHSPGGVPPGGISVAIGAPGRGLPQGDPVCGPHSQVLSHWLSRAPAGSVCPISSHFLV